jgi:branched-chain amino acid transport system permease protein
MNALQLLVGGLALGSNYALIALGFVIIYKSAGVLNFAQGGLLMIGAYATYDFINVVGLQFWHALVAAMIVTGLIGVAIQELVLRRMIGRPEFTIIMVTWALLVILDQIPSQIWGQDMINLGDPWGLAMIKIGSLSIFTIDAWTLLLTAVAVSLVFLFFRFAALGIAMRAAASDLEASIAQGISPRLVFAVGWFMASALACLAGTMLSGGANVLSPDLSLLALVAFPAVVLGGMKSPWGAVVGGMIIGVTEVMTAAVAAPYASWLGHNFYQVMPYILLVVILIVRPYGLFGGSGARRA